MVKILDKIWKWLNNNFMQFMQFGFVGLSNTVVSILTYSVFVFIGIHYLVANVFSYILGTLNSYYWNSKYVFKVENGEKRNSVAAFIKMSISYAFTGIFLNSLLSLFWIEVLEISKYMAPFCNMMITIPLNYILNKFWAMKSGNGKNK